MNSNGYEMGVRRAMRLRLLRCLIVGQDEVVGVDVSVELDPYLKHFQVNIFDRLTPNDHA